MHKQIQKGFLMMGVLLLLSGVSMGQSVDSEKRINILWDGDAVIKAQEKLDAAKYKLKKNAEGVDLISVDANGDTLLLQLFVIRSKGQAHLTLPTIPVIISLVSENYSKPEVQKFVDAQNQNGDTVLILMSAFTKDYLTSSNIEIIKAILKAGANPLVMNHENKTALMKAEEANAYWMQQQELAKSFGDSGKQFLQSTDAPLKITSEIVDVLKKAEADWNAQQGAEHTNVAMK